MLFIIAGISTKRIKKDNAGQICPNCGLYRLYRFRDDNYFNLFFIPVFRISKGAEYMMCEICDKPDLSSSAFRSKRNNCVACGASLKKKFKFCPNCGNKI